MSLRVRIQPARKKQNPIHKIQREVVSIPTRFGDIAIKISRVLDRVVTIAPEYEPCKKIARQMTVPLKTVYDEAQAAAIKQF